MLDNGGKWRRVEESGGEVKIGVLSRLLLELN